MSLFSSLFLAAEGAGDFVNSIGVELFEEQIDDVIFQTNEFLTDETFIGEQGPFWWILQMCMALGALFAIIMAAGQAYKMMVKGESFDPLKILRVLGVAFVMFFWYADGGVLDCLAYIPNCIGSYTHDLYEAEAMQVQEKFEDLKPLIAKRDTTFFDANGDLKAAFKNINSEGTQTTVGDAVNAEEVSKESKQSAKLNDISTFAGIVIMIDKIVMFIALVTFRVGWWATIYIQQIMLGMLTIFGPIMWAFSLLPKWEGAWAKWITRYLTVHFYGAMLYFVGFYVLLLFDIVISIQYEELSALLASPETFTGYLHTAFITGGYLLAASVVSLKCLNLVPDLAAWMIPEGDTAYSARSFGEGVAEGMGRKLKI